MRLFSATDYITLSSFSFLHVPRLHSLFFLSLSFPLFRLEGHVYQAADVYTSP